MGLIREEEALPMYKVAITLPCRIKAPAAKAQREDVSGQGDPGNGGERQATR